MRPPVRDVAELTALIHGNDRILVEASPVDRIWGIGLPRDEPAAVDPARWRGLSLLRFALMRVRAALADEAYDGR